MPQNKIECKTYPIDENGISGELIKKFLKNNEDLFL